MYGVQTLNVQLREQHLQNTENHSRSVESDLNNNNNNNNNNVWAHPFTQRTQNLSDVWKMSVIWWVHMGYVAILSEGLNHFFLGWLEGVDVVEKATN